MRNALWLVGVTLLAGCGDGQAPAQNQAIASQANAAAPASSAPSASSQWQHLGADPDQNIGYAYDPRSVRRNGDLVEPAVRDRHGRAPLALGRRLRDRLLCGQRAFGPALPPGRRPANVT